MNEYEYEYECEYEYEWFGCNLVGAHTLSRATHTSNWCVVFLQIIEASCLGVTYHNTDNLLTNFDLCSS